MASETVQNRKQSIGNDMKHHTGKLKEMLQQAARHAREDIPKIEDPKARALFEVTAEVLDGLTKAFSHFEDKTETAWR